jgi:NADH-quinone oxidoreductase subunit N
MPSMPTLADILPLAPEIVLAAAGLLLLLFGVVGKGGGMGHRDSALFALLSLAMTGGVLWRVRAVVPPRTFLLARSFVVDDFGFFWKVLVLGATALVVLLSLRYVEEAGYAAPEYYALLLLATTGMLFMAGAYNLLTIWISLETMALSSYVLAGYFKREVRSNEAALKYFILGALSSGILLYGISLIYGATGSIDLGDLARAGTQTGNGAGVESPLLTLGWLLLAAGLFFKVAAAPFHVWVPDAYTGAPTPVTAYLATASKIASFAVLLRIFVEGLAPLHARWQMTVALVAVASMLWGNLAALTQDNVKRMLAYSSVAHAGYTLIGLLALSEVGLSAILFYLLTYGFITIGAFGLVIVLERREYAGERVADYAGLSKRAPALAAAMLLFLLALTGIPPTGGFVGKLYLFAAAIQSGWAWVAVVGVLTSALSLYFYLRIVVAMYLQDDDKGAPTPLKSPALLAAIAICALATLVLGLVPGPVLDFAKASLPALP